MSYKDKEKARACARVIAKRRYLRLISTEEGLAKMREKGRADAIKMRERRNLDPILLEKRRAVVRAYYQRNKENIRAKALLSRRPWDEKKSKACKASYYKHKEKKLEKHRAWYAKNKASQAEKRAKWRADNPHYAKNRASRDLIFSLTQRIRCRIAMAIRRSASGSVKRGPTIDLLGCSYDFFKGYIEGKFTDGMTWEKVMSAEIELDHIRPLASFFLLCPLHQADAFHYSNVQPLWRHHNRAKSCRLDWKPEESSAI